MQWKYSFFTAIRLFACEFFIFPYRVTADTIITTKSNRLDTSGFITVHHKYKFSTVHTPLTADNFEFALKFPFEPTIMNESSAVPS